jgi:cation-transporting ATPase E
VAKVVLLDDDFTSLPRVLGEGRRVLANIERVANLFLTKTVYSVVLAVLIGLAHLPYPMLPRHITLIAGLTIGIPGFFLALAPSDERARSGFVPRVLRFAVPAGLVCAAASFASYRLAHGDLRAERSVATITLFLVAFFALTLVARPVNRRRAWLLATMAGAFALVLAWPAAREVADLVIPDPGNALVVLGVAATAGLALYAGLQRTHWPGAPAVPLRRGS